MEPLYSCKDFSDWVQAKHYLHSTPSSGMWECPDFDDDKIIDDNTRKIEIERERELLEVLFS